MPFYGIILWSMAVNFLYIITWKKLGKVLAELVLFSVEKVRALHLTSFLLSVLL